MPRYQFPCANPEIKALAMKKQRPQDVYRSELESHYPRVMQAIQALWGHDELTKYFETLMMDDRGDREGFPASVWEEIYLLEKIHQQVLPFSQRKRRQSAAA